MTESVEPVAPPLRTWRPMAAWTAGILLALGLAWFICVLAASFVQVRAAVGRIDAAIERIACGQGAPATEGKAPELEVAALGGPEKAAAKCSLYLRCPEWLATDDQKGTAFMILSACGPPAVPRAESLLRSSNGHVRADAARVLGELKDPQSVKLLTCALQDPESQVRWAVLVSLGKLRVSRAVAPLIEALSDPSSSAFQRQEAAGALGESGDLRAIEPLVKVLKDSDAFVRMIAADALGKFKDPRAIEPLKELLGDSEGVVRSAAAEALKKIRAEEPKP